MIEVALETSTRRASVALRSPAGLVERFLDPEQAHASELLPTLARLLVQAGVTPCEIDAVYVGLGPGSYTGLRVGLATALGLVRGARAELRGEASAEALCFEQLEVGAEGVFLLDARQAELYFARYRRNATGLETLRAPCVLDAAATRAELAGDHAMIFADAGAAAAAELDEAEVARLRSDVVPGAGALLELARERLRLEGAHAAAELEPLYLRGFRAKPRRR